jgi:hypothetical protein
MVASRRPKAPARKHPETLEAKFQRIMREPVGAPIKMTTREARFFARRLWETGDPSAPSGDTVMRNFYGPCDCDACSSEEPAEH